MSQPEPVTARFDLTPEQVRRIIASNLGYAADSIDVSYNIDRTDERSEYKSVVSVSVTVKNFPMPHTIG